MTEDPSSDRHCTQCDRSLSFRQTVIDWVPVMVVVIKEVVLHFWP
ncbi:hypothetical protein [Streptomyces sp. NPDC057690]